MLTLVLWAEADYDRGVSPKPGPAVCGHLMPVCGCLGSPCGPVMCL